MHCTSHSLLAGAFGAAIRNHRAPLPVFLLPSLATQHQSTSFSTTARQHRNPNAGVSALRHTGLNKHNVPAHKLPQPVRDPAKRSKVQVDEDHGLWGFFNKERTSLIKPADLDAHGRHWRVPELRNKDWEDLHRLWWVCIKEINRIKTFKAERARVGEMYGDHEADIRLRVVRRTQKSIKHTLTERWYAWENARQAAMEDEEVDLYADQRGEPAYKPKEQQDEPVSGDSVKAGESLPLPPPPDNTALREQLARA